MANTSRSLKDLFPDKGRLVLSGTGKEFIEKIGIEATRQVVLGILCGENLRSQTEPLTRQRISLVSGSLVHLFTKGWAEVPDFTNKLSSMALSDLSSSLQGDKTIIWPAQWLIGLTGKSFQNVLRSNAFSRNKYVNDFESAVKDAAERCALDFGNIKMTLGFVEELGKAPRYLSWNDIIRLTTAIGAATLTIRGSDKSTYGKLFERLVLGSVLTILGFEYVDSNNTPKIEKVFWLSDSSDNRECDATVRIKAGKLIRFDIGFIGKGNPEIMKDKLSRYSRDAENHGVGHVSQSFIIVDRMPDTVKTRNAARESGSEIIQMSLRFWPKELAQKMKDNFGYESKILSIPEAELHDYLALSIEPIVIQNFLSSFSVNNTIENIDEDE